MNCVSITQETRTKAVSSVHLPKTKYFQNDEIQARVTSYPTSTSVALACKLAPFGIDINGSENRNTSQVWSIRGEIPRGLLFINVCLKFNGRIPYSRCRQWRIRRYQVQFLTGTFRQAMELLKVACRIMAQGTFLIPLTPTPPAPIIIIRG